MKQYKWTWCFTVLAIIIAIVCIVIQETSVNPYDFTQVRVVAHRGYGEPENSLKAYQNAYDAGFKYVETDVRFTKDNVPVCIHDTKVDRVSNGKGVVENFSLSDLQRLDFHGESVLTFQDFLTFCISHDLSPYVDIKNHSLYSQEQIVSLVDLVRQVGWLDKTTWISYDLHYLNYVKEADASARLGLISSGVNEDVIASLRLLATSQNEVFLDVNHVNDIMIQMCRDASVPLEFWTLSRVPTNGQYIDSYISGFTTDVLLY